MSSSTTVFISDADKLASRALRAATAKDLPQFTEKLQDKRSEATAALPGAQLPIKPGGEQREAWEAHPKDKLLTGGPASPLARYFNRLQRLAAGSLTSQQEYPLTELQLYGESITPGIIACDSAFAVNRSELELVKEWCGVRADGAQRRRR